MSYASRGLWKRWAAIGAEWQEMQEVFSNVKDIYTWHTEWFKRAESYERRAAEGSGPETMKRYMKAFVYYYISQYPLFYLNDEKRNTYERLVHVYTKGSWYFSIPPKRIEIQYNGNTYPCHVRIPFVDGKCPAVFFIHGIESSKEEIYLFENELLKYGIATITFDGPGQGEPLVLRSAHAIGDFENCAVAVLDNVRKQCPGLEISRIGVVGISFGGTPAIKLSSMNGLVDACVDFGAFYDISKLYSNYPLPARLRIQLSFGMSEKKDVENRLSELALRDTDGQIKCPLLVIYGKKDRFVPFSHKEKILAMASGEKTMKIYEDGEHSCSRYLGEIRSNIAVWLNERLK